MPLFYNTTLLCNVVVVKHKLIYRICFEIHLSVQAPFRCRIHQGPQ